MARHYKERERKPLNNKAKKRVRTLSLPESYFDRVTEKAKEQVCPRTTVVEYLIDHYLDKVKVWDF